MNSTERLNSAVRIQRILLLAMAAALMSFTVVAIALDGGKADPQFARTGLIILGAFAVMEVPAYFVVRWVLRSQLRSKVAILEDDAAILEAVSGARFSTVIIGGAMAEGIGLFAAVMYFLSGERLVLAMIAVALALILAQFPTRQSIIDLAAQVTGRRWE